MTMTNRQAETSRQTALRPPDLRKYSKDGGLRLRLHAGQVEAWNSEARFVAIISGTQGGKTSFAPHWLLREIRKRGSGDYLYVTPSFTLLDKKALPEFLEVFENKGQLGRWWPSKMKFIFSEAGMNYMHGEGNYDPEKPTTVFFGHASNPESLESATALAAVLDEAGQNAFKLDSWEAILRRVALNEGRVLICTTPYNLGWLYKEVYLRWKNGDKNYHVINFASTMNPRFPKSEAERAKETLPKWKYEMFYLGRFSRPAGLIYDIYDEELNETEPIQIDDSWHRVIGIDFGGVNTAAVYYALHPYLPKYYQYREYYPRKTQTVAEHACSILENEPTAQIDWQNFKVKYNRKLITVVAGSLSEVQWRVELAAAGMQAIPTMIKDVELGIDRVYGAVKQRRLQVFNTCRYTRDEFTTYSRKVDDEGNAIAGTIQDKERYHLLDSTRYGISFISDSTRSNGWDAADIAKLNPDGGVDIQQLLDEELISEDDPRIKTLLKQQRQTHKLLRDRRSFNFDDDENTY